MDSCADVNDEFKGKVYVSEVSSWTETVARLLDATHLIDQLRGKSLILIKPNLVEALKPPITTPVGLVEAVIDYLVEKIPAATIMIGEGTGSSEYDTFRCFEVLGYTTLAKKKNINLIDLNVERLVELENKKCRRWPKMYDNV